MGGCLAGSFPDVELAPASRLADYFPDVLRAPTSRLAL